MVLTQYRACPSHGALAGRDTAWLLQLRRDAADAMDKLLGT